MRWPGVVAVFGDAAAGVTGEELFVLSSVIRACPAGVPLALTPTASKPCMSTHPSPSRPGTRFPTLPIYAGFDKPGRVEADIFELEIEGALPIDLEGTFYRVAPEPQFPPLLGDDIVINGDGMIALFRFANGHVDFRSRYVRTEKFALERSARRALFGAYRNPYTDDVSVRGLSRGTANTNVMWHGGKLLALKEDSPPVEVDPNTLQTRGTWDYNGALTSRTFTA